jgi:hypothetical protein
LDSDEIFDHRTLHQSASGSSCDVRNKYDEATKQQDGARRQWNIRHQGCKSAGEQNDRKDR